MPDLGSTLTNYSMANTGTLLQEGWSKVTASIGQLNPFTKAAVGAPPAPAQAAKETQGTAASIRTATQSSDSADGSTGHKVKLVAPADNTTVQFANDVNFVRAPLGQVVVEFDVMPEVQEIHTVEYEPVAAPQMPTEFQKYRGTKAVQWQINGSFVCRTRAEAYRNYIFLNNLRSWTKPFFGEKQRLQFDGGSTGSGKLGAPPPVLKFSGWRELVGEVPVIITSLNWNFPKDCDWIPCGVFDSEGKEVPFPTIMTVNVALIESLAPDQVNGFDLVAFRNGHMVNAWLAENDQPRSYDRAEPMRSNGGNQSIANGTAQGVAPTVSNTALPAPKVTTADYLTRAKAAIDSAVSSVGSALSGATQQVKDYFTPTPALPVQLGDFPAESSSTLANIAQPTDEA